MTKQNKDEAIADLAKVNSSLQSLDDEILKLEARKDISIRSLDPTYKVVRLQNDETWHRIKTLPSAKTNKDVPMNSILINLIQGKRNDNALHFLMKGSANDTPAVNRPYRLHDLDTFILMQDIETKNPSKLYSFASTALEEKLNLVIATADITFSDREAMFSVELSDFGEKNA